MSEDDSELQRLQAKRLAEMQKNISSRDDSIETPEPSKEKPVNPRDVLIKQLGFRGLEVLTNAESQFPNETKMIIDKLYELVYLKNFLIFLQNINMMMMQENLLNS